MLIAYQAYIFKDFIRLLGRVFFNYFEIYEVVGANSFFLKWAWCAHINQV